MHKLIFSVAIFAQAGGGNAFDFSALHLDVSGSLGRAVVLETDGAPQPALMAWKGGLTLGYRLIWGIYGAVSTEYMSISQYADSNKTNYAGSYFSPIQPTLVLRFFNIVLKGSGYLLGEYKFTKMTAAEHELRWINPKGGTASLLVCPFFYCIGANVSYVIFTREKIPDYDARAPDTTRGFRSYGAEIALKI